MSSEKIKVVELFAGVGGFRIGLEKNKNFKIIWSNQWEPSTKKQHASDVYEARFGKNGHTNEDITELETSRIPDCDVLVGGFPCQDYSVATSLYNSKGLIGKKGVLWWTIHRILKEKKNKPKYLFLENVDRLLKSPASQRGKDFAVMLKSLDQLGYAVEWRVINAAEYGMPQRRRRVFFLAYHKSTDMYTQIMKIQKSDWLTSDGTIARAFPVANNVSDNNCNVFELTGDLVQITTEFNKGEKSSPFLNSGVMVRGVVYTTKTMPFFDGDRITLGDVIEKNVSPEFYLDLADLPKWNYMKGAKREVRKSKEGFEYNYSEGGMVFPDALDNASRTVITGEGGKTASRFKHVVQTKNGLRRLTPRELERLNMFPDDHTKLDGISDAKRAFFMGNALVVGVVEKIGEELYERLNEPIFKE